MAWLIISGNFFRIIYRCSYLLRRRLKPELQQRRGRFQVCSDGLERKGGGGRLVTNRAAEYVYGGVLSSKKLA